MVKSSIIIVVGKCFMLTNKNLKETAFNYCPQWSGVDNQEIDCSIISMGAMSHAIWRLPLEGMASTNRNAQPLFQIYESCYASKCSTKGTALWKEPHRLEVNKTIFWRWDSYFKSKHWFK